MFGDRIVAVGGRIGRAGSDGVLSVGPRGIKSRRGESWRGSDAPAGSPVARWTFFIFLFFYLRVTQKVCVRGWRVARSAVSVRRDRAAGEPVAGPARQSVATSVRCGRVAGPARQLVGSAGESACARLERWCALRLRCQRGWMDGWMRRVAGVGARARRGQVASWCISESRDRDAPVK